MKIGIWLGNDTPSQQGGAFSYISKLIEVIDNYEFDDRIQIVYLTFNKEFKAKRDYLCISTIPQWVYRLFERSSKITRYIQRIDVHLFKTFFHKSCLNRNEIKLIYYIKQAQVEIPDYPFIATNWDIGHRSTLCFPELINRKEFKRRERVYNELLPRALFVFCESEAGKQELVRYTKINEDRIKIVPLFAGDVVKIRVDDNYSSSVLTEFGLSKEKFFFYPAQFWAHKNHYNLIRAFARFNNDYPDYKLVLCGSNKGNKGYIVNLIAECGLSNNIIITRFLTNEELYVLYSESTGLIMASHFGPTNMPPIEAMEIGCPVICSDLIGHKEILGDAAVYFNSFDMLSIYDSLKLFIENRPYYHMKIKERNRNNLFSSEHAVKSIEKNLLEACEIRANWE